MPHILIVDDDTKVREALLNNLSDLGFSISLAASGEDALLYLQTSIPDAVLLDQRMPGLDGIATLIKIRERSSNLPVIIFTGYGDIDLAVKAIKHGATDFLLKPLNMDLLVMRLNKAVSEHDMRGRLSVMEQGMVRSLEDRLGRNQRILEIIEIVKRVAWTDYSIILEGETGVGKSYLARIIHDLSRRAANRLVEIDIGVLPETLIESELFGFEKGAFTGADRKKIGHLEISQGGSIFLDEIHNIPPQIQMKLLRVIEDKKVCPVGGSSEIKLDTRFIAATNRNLRLEVEEGRFRQDLYYRLNEITIHLPPLRERTDDILFFAERFISDCAEELGKGRPVLSKNAVYCMCSHAWPGNIRELRNVIRKAVLFSEGLEIDERLFAQCISAPLLRPVETASQMPASLPLMPLRDLEQRMIVRALEHFSGNKKRAAELLGIDYRTILRKFKEYNLQD